MADRQGADPSRPDRVSSQLRFEQVSLQFSNSPRPTLHKCNLQVEAGEFVVILGPSGCGKTTLLKLVNRLYQASQGRILVDNRDIRKIPVTELRRQIGYVIQQVGLFPHMTVGQNIAVVPRLLGWGKTRVQARTDQLLDLVQLPPQQYRDRYPAQLSGGQQQRVGLARALAGDPGILLMDEPFGALDALTRSSLQTELLRLQQQLGKTVLFVSHDIDEALRLGDRILVLNQGQIVQFDTPLQLLTQPATPFVAALVGAEDSLRQLGLLRLETVMVPCPPTPQQALPVLSPAASLREGLTLLLRSGAPTLLVQAETGILGQVSLAEIRQVIQASPSSAAGLEV